METDSKRRRVAEPAEEEIKKHGDQLKTPVEEAAGKKQQNEAQQQPAQPERKD